MTDEIVCKSCKNYNWRTCDPIEGSPAPGGCLLVEDRNKNLTKEEVSRFEVEWNKRMVGSRHRVACLTAGEPWVGVGVDVMDAPKKCKRMLRIEK